MSDPADATIAHIIGQRDLLQAFHEHCQSISARVTSRDGSVSVEVDGLGTMTGLWLGPRAARLGPAALATLIVDTAAAAAGVCVERQNYLTAEFDRRRRALEDAAVTGRDDDPAAGGR